MYKHQDFIDETWNLLVNSDKKDYMMCASTPGVDRYTERGDYSQSGIVPGHAYSVIEADKFQDVCLLKIRNPWGEGEWDGAWSDKSPEWNRPGFITHFEPKFDLKDGTFFMEYHDFLKNFNGLNICKIANWYDLRLRGKFIRCWEKEDPDEDWVLSKFYYRFKLFDHTKITIGIHQEDERIIGADRRRYLDMQLIIIKRHANGTLTIAAISESKSDRDVEVTLDLPAGDYIVIPRTCGAAMSAPSNPKPPVPTKIEVHGKERMHKIYASTFDDIFRKIDLQLNGQLSAKEINQFGDIIENDVMSDLDVDDFSSEKFSKIS